MKGGRRLGGKINMSNSAVKKLLSTIRVITTKLRKAKTSAFQGEKKKILPFLIVACLLYHGGVSLFS